MDNKLVLGIAIGLGLGLLGLAALFFWQRSKAIALGRLPLPESSASYTNEERTDITWNEEGLPIRIIVLRKATRQ